MTVKSFKFTIYYGGCFLIGMLVGCLGLDLPPTIVLGAICSIVWWFIVDEALKS